MLSTSRRKRGRKGRKGKVGYDGEEEGEEEEEEKSKIGYRTLGNFSSFRKGNSRLKLG